jgi:hypothetical protein
MSNKEHKPTENELNLYGVIFMYFPYNGFWLAYPNSEYFNKDNSGRSNEIPFEILKSKSLTTLKDFIYENGYVKFEKGTKKMIRKDDINRTNTELQKASSK